MRRLFTIAAASAVATLFATPAFATAVSGRTDRAPVLQRTALDGSTVCLRSVNSRACADYQAQLLRTVETKATAKRTAISAHDLGSRQLEALIASVN